MAEEQATLAGGCFWCTEAVFDDVIGVSTVQSGYTGGTVPDPNYKQVINEKIKKDIAPMLMYDAKFQSINEDTAFYVKDEGVAIYFGVYEYTPYAAGFPEFYIPFSAVSPSLEGKLPF